MELPGLTARALNLADVGIVTIELTGLACFLHAFLIDERIISDSSFRSFGRKHFVTVKPATVKLLRCSSEDPTTQVFLVQAAFHDW